MLAPVRALAAALSLLPVLPLSAQVPEGRPPEAFQLAVGLQQRGLFDEAGRQYETFLKDSPQHPLAAEASYRLGVCCAEGKQDERAIAALQKALQLGGEGFRLRPECRYRLGHLLAAAGKVAEAAAMFDALGREVGKDHYLRAPAAFAAGEAHRDRKDDRAAAAAFRAAAAAATGEQTSFRFPALYQLGFALVRQQDHEGAAAAFGEAAAAAPDQPAKGECLYLRGDAELRRQQWDDAARDFAAAGPLAPDFADDAALGLGFVALGRGDGKAAQKAFRTVLEQHAESPLAGRARLELGRSLYQDKQPQRAAEVLAPLGAAGVPEELGKPARELLGLCGLQTGAGEAALQALQKALAEAGPADQPRLSFAVGEALANLKRHADAVAAYDAVPDGAPAALRGDARYGACFALHALGRFDESTARAKQVLAITPPHRLAAPAAFAIGENLYAQQKYEAAEQAYAAVREPGPLADKLAWKLAWCRYLRGDKKVAGERFAAIGGGDGAFAEEALVMQALALLEDGQTDGALAAADRYLARHRGGAFVDRAERIAARALQKRGDVAGARQRLERAAAAAREADRAGDVAEQAELAWQQGDYRAADGLFAQLASRDDASGARALAGRAWCAFEVGDDEACAKWLAAAAAHPRLGDQQAGVLELQSALCHRRQDWAGAAAAAQAFLAAYGKHPKAPALRYSLGVAQARAGDSAAAAATLAALQKDGGYERMDRVAYELGWALRRKGDEPGALAAFAVVAAKSADAELAGEANLHLGVAALDAKDLATARDRLAKVEGSQRGRARYRLGFAEFEAAGADAQRLAVARDLFAEVAALPGEALAGEALYLGGECCRRLGDPRGACERLQQLLQTSPKHERADAARLLLGECAVALGDGDRAVAPLEEYLRGADRGPADAARAGLALGRARQLRGEADKAEANFTKVTSLGDGPLAAEAQFRIGEVRAQRGDLQGAADAFVKLPILYAHPEWVRKGLLQAGLVYERLQQPDKAQRFFKELAEQHGDSDEGRQARSHLQPGTPKSNR